MPLFFQRAAKRRTPSPLLIHGDDLKKRRALAQKYAELRGKRQVFVVDLSTVVSKYIGETEKNLTRLLERAEKENILLLFDEADALFGKRSEVKDSHDRYANQEVSYLRAWLTQNSEWVVIGTRAKPDDSTFRRLIPSDANESLLRARTLRRDD